jgi:ABC-type multidrug transport system ATPase subunit
MQMVIADEIVKSFPQPDGREKRAVDGLSFRVEAGTMYGLLGPNGAGKTTTLRILSGLMQPTGGRAIMAGHDVAVDPVAVKRSIGFLTANTGLYQRLTSRELLVYFAGLHGMDKHAANRRVDALIEWLDMNEFENLRCGALSTGQKQRTSIARALVADPPILILDEPTLGLDVLSNRVILDFIMRERQVGKTILLCTHHLDEAESMCDHIGLLHKGRLVAEGTIMELRRQSGVERLSDIFLKIIHADSAGDLVTTAAPSAASAPFASEAAAQG